MTRLERLVPFTVAIWAVGVQLNEAIAAVGFATTAAIVIASRPPWSEWRRFLPLLVFIASAILAPCLAARFPTGTGAMRLLNLVGVPIAAIAVARLSPGARRGVLIAAGVTLAVSCLIAALQHFGLWPSPETMRPLAALKIPVDRMYEEVPGEPGHFMGGGLAFHRLKFAHVESLAVLTLLSVALRSEGRSRAITLGFALFGFLSVLWFPYTRAAAVSLVLAAAVLVALGLGLSARRSLLVALGLVLIAAAGLALLPGFRERLLASTSTEGSGGRTQLRAAGIAAVKAHPLLGTGVGRFRLADWAPPDSPAYVLEHSGKTHNQYLSIAAESGIPAALLFLFALATLALTLLRERARAPFGISALVFFALLCLTHDPLFHPEFGMALALVLGAAYSQPPMSRR